MFGIRKKENDSNDFLPPKRGRKKWHFCPHAFLERGFRSCRRGRAGYKIAINNRPREFFVAGHKSPRQSSPRFFRATFPSSSVLQRCRQRAARSFAHSFHRVSVVRRRWSISLRIAILISARKKEKREKEGSSSVNHRYCRSTKGRGRSRPRFD